MLRVLIILLALCLPGFALGEANCISPDTLGLTPVLVRGGNEAVQAEVKEDGNVVLTPLAPGEAVLTVCNEYSETAQIKAVVGDDLLLEFTCTPFEAPSHTANVLDFGAVGTDKKDDTAAIQKAIDSLMEGGTVYFPAGVYTVSNLILREGVHLRLAGCLEDAKVGYTDAVKAWAESGEIAILRTNYGNNHMFYNLRRGGYCTEGVSNFSFSGGMIDCRSGTMAFVWACAENVVLENCIIKDNPNNHAIQIDGCTNVIIRNVMFAGYQYGGTHTAETIQIEPTTAGAISGNYATSPVKCKDGDFHFNSNIVITGCYFGKSDNNGPHLTPVGHHSVTGAKTVVDGLEFSNNVVDNPLLYGMHLLNYANVRVVNNTFISDGQTKALEEDTALICIATQSSNRTYKTSKGVTIDYACANELEASKHIEISGNRFILGGGTMLRVLHIGGTTYTPGVTWVSEKTRTDAYGEEHYLYTGYLTNSNYVEDIRFADNEISITSPTGYTDYLLYANRVYDLVIERNAMDAAAAYSCSSELNGTAVPGLKKYYGRNGLDRVAVVGAPEEGEAAIWLADAAGEAQLLTCQESGLLWIWTTEGGDVVFTTARDGSVTVTPKAQEGYAFVGWQNQDGSAAQFPEDLTTRMMITAAFAAQ